MKKRQLIQPIIILIISLFLLGTVIYGWFSQPESAGTNAIHVQATDFKLEEGKIDGIFDETTSSFIEMNNADLNNMFPGDYAVLRLKLTVADAYKIVLSFSELASVLNERIHFDENGVYVGTNFLLEEFSLKSQTISGVDVKYVPISVMENNMVIEKKLYIEDKKNENQMLLADYKIENTFKGYFITNSQSDTIDMDGFDLSTIEYSALLSDFSMNVDLQKGVNYVFIALEYNEELSNVIENFSDGSSKNHNSNCFQFQTIKIGKILLTNREGE